MYFRSLLHSTSWLRYLAVTLVALLCGVTGAFAYEYTGDFGISVFDNYNSQTRQVLDSRLATPFTINVTSSGNSLNFTGSFATTDGELRRDHVRVNPGGAADLTFKAPYGYVLTTVEFDYSGSNNTYAPATLTSNPTTSRGNLFGDNCIVWYGNSQEVTFTMTARSDQQIRLKEIYFTYEKVNNDIPDAPALDPPGGTYTGTQRVFITNYDSNVLYYYRKGQNQGSWEGDDKAKWGQVTSADNYINMTKVDEGQQWLTVVAVNPSDTSKKTYTYEQYIIQDSVQADYPTFSPGGGEYSGPQRITLSSTQSDVTIFYMVSDNPLDSSKPYTDDQWNWSVYSGPITIDHNCYIFAYANGDAYKASEIRWLYYRINQSTLPSPELSYKDPVVTVEWANKDNYHGQTLINPHGVTNIVYSLLGQNVDRVVQFNDVDGTFNIIGSGTVYVCATYPGSDTYSYQMVSYQLVVNPEPSDSSMTFMSGNTVLITVARGTETNPQTITVPDGVVINLRANGYADNCVIMAKVAQDDSNDGNPSWVVRNNGSMRNEEITDANGYYTKSNFQYLGRGIPIYKSDEPNQPISLIVRIYNPTNQKKNIAQFYLHLNVQDNPNRPDKPTALPETAGNSGERDAHTKLSLSESATVQGEDSATIYAKYSNSSVYTPRELLAEENLSIGTGKVGVFSTLYNPERRTTAIQVRHNQEWNGQYYDVASDVMTAYYYYVPNRHKVRLEAINNPIRKDMTNDAGNLTDTLDVKCYVDEVEQTTLPSRLKYYYTTSNPNVVTVSDDGVATMHGAGSATILVRTLKIDADIVQVKDDDYAADETKPGYEAAVVAFNVYVTDVANQTLIPPTFSPATDRDYYATFKATVVANLQDEKTDDLAVGDAYYVLVDDNNEGNIDFNDGNNIINPDRSVVMASGHVAVNGTRTVDIPIVHKDGTPLDDGDSYTLYAVTYNPNKDSHNLSAVSSVTYTYRIIIVDPPVLTPGTRGSVGDESKIYSFIGDSLVVTASTTTPGAQVYYTINSASDGVYLSNGRLYSGDTKIVLKESAIVRAMAYFDGVYSEVVTYLYRKARPAINTPTYVVNNTDLGENQSHVYVVHDIDREARIFLHCNVDVKDNGQLVDITDTSLNYYDAQNGYVIYYTTDGTWPTSRSNVYDPRVGLTFDYDITVRAFCKQLSSGATGLSSQLSIEITNGMEVWEADTASTCPNGVLKDNIISRRVQNANTSTAPHDITITLGVNGQRWSVNDVIEDYKGNRIDDYGNVDIIAQNTSGMTGGNITDADDELGVLYNHAYAQLNAYSVAYNDTLPTGATKASTRAKGVYESTFKLPSHGTYVKFEPEKDGNVTIWCEQNGGMHYSNGANSNDRFYNQFIRKRPAYFVDEQGRAISATSINASGLLNNRWDEIDRSALLDMGGIEDGLPQTLFTKAEAQDIYDMYHDRIAAARAVNPGERHIYNLIVELNNGHHQTAAGAGVDINDDRGTDDNVIDGTGYCIPSASYMKYTFPVRAGKTYFFFAVKTKIGISALGFKANEDSTQRQTLTLDEGSATAASDNLAKIDAAIENGHTANVTVKRSLTAGRWAAMVLPFSMSATQVERTFGTGTIIQHYYGFDEVSPISYINMAQHDHQMIVAGTPFFICPATTMNEFSVNGVQIEKDTIDRVFDQKNGSDVLMNGTYDFTAGATPLYGFYVQAGRLVQARSHTVDQKATRAWLEGVGHSVTAKVGFRNAQDEDVTGITVVNDDTDDSSHNTDENIYSISGMIMGRGESDLRGLKPGVYIFHGRKLLIQ